MLAASDESARLIGKEEFASVVPLTGSDRFPCAVLVVLSKVKLAMRVVG